MSEFDELMKGTGGASGQSEFERLMGGAGSGEESGGSVAGAAKQFAHGLPVGMAEFGDVLPGGQAIRAARAAGIPVPRITDVVKGGLGAAGLDPGKPKGFLEGLGKTAGEFFGNPISYAGPGRALPKIATTATAALGSETAGQLTEGTEAEPWARLLGAVGGGVLPSALARGVTPLPARNAADVERHRLNRVLEEEGVTASAGQVSGRRGVKVSETELGEAPGAGGLAQLHNERVAEDYANAALRRVRETRRPDEPLSDAVVRADDRIGAQFDALAARNRAPYTPGGGPYAQDLLNRARQYEHLRLDPMRAPTFEHTLEHLRNHILQNTEMSGAFFQAERSRIGRIIRSTKDPELREFLAGVQGAMDNLMESGIARNNPRDLGAWRQARNDYRNLLPILRVSSGGGEGAALGDLSPARMRQAITRTDADKKRYARGEGDYADLVKAGNALLTPLPNSMTGARWFSRAVPSGIGAAIGGTLGAAGGPVGVAGGAGLGATLGGLAGPAIAGRVLHARPTQAWLKNQRAAAAQRALRESHPAARALASGGTSAIANADEALNDAALPINAEPRSGPDALSDASPDPVSPGQQYAADVTNKRSREMDPLDLAKSAEGGGGGSGLRAPQVATHIETLKKASSDNTAFDTALNNLKTDRSIRLDEMREIAKNYLGWEPGRSNGRSDLLRHIQDRQALDARQNAKMQNIDKWNK